MSDRLRERLETFLTDFRAHEPVAPDWLGTPDTRSLLIAWAATPPTLGEPLFLGAPPMHRHNRWNYVWKYRRIDHDKLAADARLPVSLSRDLFVKLVAAHMIYPDGTLARAATAILASANN